MPPLPGWLGSPAIPFLVGLPKAFPHRPAPSQQPWRLRKGVHPADRQWSGCDEVIPVLTWEYEGGEKKFVVEIAGDTVFTTSPQARAARQPGMMGGRRGRTADRGGFRVDLSGCSLASLR